MLWKTMQQKQNRLLTPAIFSAILSFWWMWTSESVRNIQARNHALKAFLINPLDHINQKEEITVEIGL